MKKQSGQATIEYILLLVVTVAIAAALGSKLIKPFKKWSDFYLGTYTYCLLDTGSLPGIAGGHPEECDKLAEESGFGPKANKNDEKSSQEKDKSKSSAGLNSSPGGKRRGRGGAGGGGRSGADSAVTLKNSSGEGGPTDDKTRARIPLDKYRPFVSQASAPGDRRKGSFLQSLYKNESEKIKKREERVFSINTEGDGGPQLKRPFLEAKNTKRETEAKETEGSFNLGQMLRIAVILIIILGIIYLVGVQINTIMRSMEK